MDPAFLKFCDEHNIQPNDERYVFWLAGRNHEEPPVAWGLFDADGSLLGLIDALPPGIRPRPVPLYRKPIGPAKPPLTPALIHYVWRNYAPDIEGFTRWLEQHLRGD